jgi:hypothetical protein
MRPRFLSLCAVVVALCPAQGNAAVTGAPNLISAFQAICLDHIGDPVAQASQARGAPWNFDPGGSVGAMTRYRSGLGALGIGEAAKACTITAEIDPGINLSGFKRLMATALSLDEGTPLVEADSVYWLIVPDQSDQQYVLSLKVSGQTGRNLATLWVQNRESLNQ